MPLFLVKGNQTNQRWFPCPECWFPLRRNHGFLTQEYSHAYQYFGGVTRLLIPDNLKTGVSKNTRYETILNKSYAEMAEYYETAIVPARVRAPQDKSLAEGTVKFATTWIIAALRNRKFFSLEEVKSAVKEKLDELNKTSFKKREGCRYSAYKEEEQSFMKPLPLTPFEPAVWSTAKVPLDYLITDGKNKYSVPFDLIGEQVDIRLTKATVEVFFHGSRVASHPRSATNRRDPVIQPEHMPTPYLSPIPHLLYTQACNSKNNLQSHHSPCKWLKKSRNNHLFFLILGNNILFLFLLSNILLYSN